MGRKRNFDFSQELVLEDDRVQLLPLKEDHLNALDEIAKDEAIWKYFFDKGSNTADLRMYIRSALDKRKEGIEYPFAVVDKVQNKIAGCTRFYEYNPKLNTIKLGHTWYGRAYRGTGLNKHCKFLLFNHAFENLGVERVGFGVYASNTVSIVALQSVGCKIEGSLRSMFPAIEGSGREDAILLSILKEEWNKGAKLKLRAKLQQSDSSLNQYIAN